MKPDARSPAFRSRARSMCPLALAASLALTACGSDGTGPPTPDPGPLRLMVTQAPAGAGGLLVEITGPGVGTATSIGSYRVWQTAPGSSRTVLFLTGAVQSGPVAQLDVPDRNVAYVARVLDAAAGAGRNYERQTPSDFGVELRR